ncbi:M20 family metallopeptidase [bacterium]|nr:M20 family metallopeptidase [bacterium]
MTQGYREIGRAVAKHAKELTTLSLEIHANPELGFQEKAACAAQTAVLRRAGFTIETPFAGVRTAYKAVRGKGAPVFCFTAEYDALPEIGHACGHNLIAACSVGAGIALAAALERARVRGTVVVMGTPAEESQGGKVVMIRKGALRGVDAAMMAHPQSRTMADPGCAAITRYQVTYFGRAAHAAASPHKGKNALDAIMLLFHAVNAWRQHLPESSRIHGIVTDGGAAANIVPERAQCVYFLRSPDDRILADMVKRFRNIARGAALMTDTRVSISSSTIPYKATWPNQALNAAYVDEARAVGLDPEANPKPNRASTDFGDVSHAVPGSHVYFGITEADIPGHSVAFREAAATPFAQKQMLRTAEALARVGWRFFTDAAFRKDVAKRFRERKGQR